MQYHPENIESKWRKYWVENKIYKTYNHTEKPKFYVLDMFPYPSGSGLHVGHPLGYIASDIFSRYKRLKGFNVLHPMGYDAFGLPAEQYAIQTGVHPKISTAENISRYRSQLDNIGFSFDWDRSVNTSEPEYYKWTQWIFLKLYEHYYNLTQNKAVPVLQLVQEFEQKGNTNVHAASTQETIFTAEQWNGMTAKEKDDVLMNYRIAYRKNGYVNWCEALGTVLANDEIKDGVSERGGHPVVKKSMMQWSLRITAYAERLLNDLETLSWSEALKAMQKNWIGRSEGAQLFFDLVGHDEKIEVFTTRPDTIFGATFMVLAPEHELVSKITTSEQDAEIEKYLTYVKSRSEIDRMSEVKEVSGAFTGAFAINPFTNKQIPVWIGEYVLKDYGTGAIMAVPSDDERDQLFAKKFGLQIIDVVDKTAFPGSMLSDKTGIIINSDFLNGLEVKEAISVILGRIETMNIGKRRINYKLRDANYSRQRYWGEPFPIAYDREGVCHPLDYKRLPLELPELENFKPSPDGRSPLARVAEWVESIPGYQLETDTMPGFAGSSWYFLRYMDADNPDEFASSDAIEYWQDVDLYVGGTEHAVGHLMYSRFWHKFLFDLGYVPTIEPFKKLINQGMITAYGYYADAIQLKNNSDADDEIITRYGNINDIPSGHTEVVDGNYMTISKVNTSSHRLPYVYDYLDGQNRITKDKFDEYYRETGVNFNVHSSDQFIWAVDDNSMEYFTVNVIQEKMSKSKYNVQNPDEIVSKYGADCFRMYEMFLGPIEQSKPWDTKGIDGVQKFLRKFWSLYFNEAGFYLSDETPSREEFKIIHTAIKKVSEDIERFSFNTSVSAFMVCTNELKRLECNKRAILEPLIRLLSPFAPFITEELFELSGGKGSVHHADFPELKAEYLIESEIAYPVSINGKKRDIILFPSDATSEDIEKTVMNLNIVQKWLDGQQVKKVIIVPGRMINIVV
ncbi:MAG: leucine--tRNA ligase [Saprospiraceae bacterium]|nr:leucine--tRNA ligase [Saprospiraceae bacterium]